MGVPEGVAELLPGLLVGCREEKEIQAVRTIKLCFISFFLLMDSGIW